MKHTLLKLDWDSEFFQFNVCRIKGNLNNEEDLKAIASEMGKSDYKLAYYSSTEELNSFDFPMLDIVLVDKKTTFVKLTSSSLEASPFINSYRSDVPSEKILNLAVQSGVYSRFNVDERIGREKYEEMYRLWITKSIRRENANEVIVYEHDNDIAGYLTIGEKNKRADLGMGAVDSNYRGLGIGRIIFENAEKWAYDNGYKDIQIVTQGENIAACKLYEKLGYSVESKEYFYHIWKD